MHIIVKLTGDVEKCSVLGWSWGNSLFLSSITDSLFGDSSMNECRRYVVLVRFPKLFTLC